MGDKSEEIIVTQSMLDRGVRFLRTSGRLSDELAVADDLLVFDLLRAVLGENRVLLQKSKDQMKADRKSGE